MKWFVNLNIIAKFSLCFLLLILILLGNSLFGINQQRDMHSDLTDIFENRMKSSNEIGAVSANFHKMIAHLGNFVYQSKPVEEKKQELADVAQYRSSIDELLLSLGAKPLSDKAKKELEVFEFVWNSYTPAVDEVIEETNAGQREKAVWNYESQVLKKAEGIDAYFAYFIQLNEDEAELAYRQSNESFRQAVRIAIISLLVSLLVSVALGWLMATSIRRPVRELLKHFAWVAEGVMTVSASSDRKDEMGQLLTSFERMRVSLHDVLVQTKRMIAVLGGHVSGIRQSAEETGNSASAIQEGLATASQETLVMHTQVQQDIVVINEMLTGLMEATEGVNAISLESSDSEDSVHEGKAVVAEAIDSMAGIRQRVERSLTGIGSVQAASKQIGGVLQLIEGLMRQTQILALNASIEAARGGEQGRSFNIIAQEIGRLAAQTREASDKVEHDIGAIIADIDALHGSITEEAEEVEAGIRTVERAGDRFYTISHSMTRINESLQQVSATLEELAAGGAQMDHAMDRIGQFAKATSDGMTRFVQVSEGQKLSMEQVNASVQQLVAEFEVLAARMEQFQTDRPIRRDQHEIAE